MTIRRNQINYIFKELGEYTRRKDWFNFSCPYHNGEDPNFGINLKKGIFNCFVCGESGNLIKLNGDLKKGIACTSSYSEPILGDIDPLNYEEEAPKGIFKRLNEPNLISRCDSWFRENYEHILEVEPCRIKERALTYLKKRTIDPNKINVGFLNGYNGRLVFPFQMGGSIRYFQGRSIYNMPMKTLNPDEDDGWPIKTQILYNYDELILNDEISISEGIFDGYSVGQVTNLPWTCLLGNTISDTQIKLLKVAGVKKILIVLDGNVNKIAIELGIKLFYNKFDTRVVIWPDELKTRDPNDLCKYELDKVIQEQQVRINHVSDIELLPLYG